MTPTEQRPQECEHYNPIDQCMLHNPCPNAWKIPCAFKDKRSKGYCPDFTPKTKEK